MKKMYQHALSIFMSHVYKRSRISAFATCINMCCGSLRFMSTKVAKFLDFHKSSQHDLSVFKSHVNKRSKISGFCKRYHHASVRLMCTKVAGFGYRTTYQHELSVFKPHVNKRSKISGFCKTYHHDLSAFNPHV